MWITHLIIVLLLFIMTLVYFEIADKFNIIDKPNERSSHTSVVLRGGGIIFLIGAWVWSLFYGFHYPWFLAGLTLVAGISFIDDIRSLPDSCVWWFSLSLRQWHSTSWIFYISSFGGWCFWH